MLVFDLAGVQYPAVQRIPHEKKKQKKHPSLNKDPTYEEKTPHKVKRSPALTNVGNSI